MSDVPTALAGADPALPALAAALDPTRAARAIETSKQFADTRVQVLSARLTRHKPGRRAVIAYDLAVTRANGRTDIVPAIGKMRASRPPRTAYRLLRELWAHGFDAASTDGICVPEPLGTVPELGLWLQRRVCGQLATTVLTTAAAAPLARRIAEAAHKLHTCGVAPEKAHGSKDEVAILRRIYRDVAQRHPALAPRLAHLLHDCDVLAAELTGDATGIHRDFYADQVIVDGTRLYLIDFDLFCHGHAALDLGNFAGHLAEHALREPAHVAALTAAQDALAAAYVAHAGAAATRPLRIYTALTLARHVYLSATLPGRAHTTGRVLDAAQAATEALRHGQA